MTLQPELAGAEGGANALLAYLDAQRADRAAAWPEVLATTVVSLSAQFPHFHWTGIYLVRDDVLHLGPFVGHPTEHVAIPVGEGICGAALQQRGTIVVDDVAVTDRSYLERAAERLAHLAPPAGDAATVPALNLARAERAAP